VRAAAALAAALAASARLGFLAAEADADDAETRGTTEGAGTRGRAHRSPAYPSDSAGTVCYPDVPIVRP